jgi:hypothetical protein
MNELSTGSSDNLLLREFRTGTKHVLRSFSKNLGWSDADRGDRGACHGIVRAHLTVPSAGSGACGRGALPRPVTATASTR